MIHAGFLEEIRLVRSVHHGEIAVEQIVSHAAAIIVAVIRGQGFPMSLVEGGIPGNAFGLEVHAMIVSGAERLQTVA